MGSRVEEGQIVEVEGRRDGSTVMSYLFLSNPTETR